MVVRRLVSRLLVPAVAELGVSRDYVFLVRPEQLLADGLLASDSPSVSCGGLACPPTRASFCPGCSVEPRTRRPKYARDALLDEGAEVINITEHNTDEGKLYLCAIKNARSGRSVGYSLDSRLKSKLVATALESAVQVSGDVTNCALHLATASGPRIALSKPEAAACSDPPQHGRVDGPSRFQW